ncbi:MAG: hypothetical protein Q3979_03400 [Actinomycetaceae bacterium]|nr:hypothetical protein [Actinomycetaceae bacterium]
MRRAFARARETLAVALVTGLVCACSMQLGGKATPEVARTASERRSAGPAAETDVTEIGVFDLTDGIFTFGTGKGTASITVGSGMVPFDRAYVETGVLGVEDANDEAASISISPRSALHPGMSSEDLADMLTAQNDVEAAAVEDITHVGEAKAVAADTATSEGLPSRVYLVTIDGTSWNITVKASDGDRLSELVGALDSLRIERVDQAAIGARG